MDDHADISRANQPASLESERKPAGASIFSKLPPEIIVTILSVLHNDFSGEDQAHSPRLKDLKNFSLTCKAGAKYADKFLFNRFRLTPWRYGDTGYRLWIRSCVILSPRSCVILSPRILQHIEELDIDAACNDCYPIPLRGHYEVKDFLSYISPLIRASSENLQTIGFSFTCECEIYSDDEDRKIFGLEIFHYVLNSYDFPKLKRLAKLELYRLYSHDIQEFDTLQGKWEDLGDENASDYAWESELLPFNAPWQPQGGPDDTTFWRNFNCLEDKSFALHRVPPIGMDVGFVSEFLYDRNVKRLKVSGSRGERYQASRPWIFPSRLPCPPWQVSVERKPSILTTLELNSMALTPQQMEKLLDASPQLHSITLVNVSLIARLISLTLNYYNTWESTKIHSPWLGTLRGIAAKTWRTLHIMPMRCMDAWNTYVKEYYAKSSERRFLVEVFERVKDATLRDEMWRRGGRVPVYRYEIFTHELEIETEVREIGGYFRLMS